ncbi:MAG: alcohol dehydrogenase catalytic domain-containing protein, partial [Micromonosporaceae bacterium]
MRAAVLHGRHDLRIEEVPVPRPGPGEVVLRVRAVGLCGTDAAEYAHGPAMFPIQTRHPVTGHVGPMVIGHEFAGEVVEVGEGVDPAWTGRLLASCGSLFCGDCRQCRRGRTNLCDRYAAVGLHRHGAAAQLVAVPLASCEPADERGLPPDAAALGQPMSIAVHAARRGRLAGGERVVLFGAGGIGAFLTYVLARRGVTLAVVDPDPARRDLATRLGADAVAAAVDAAPAGEAPGTGAPGEDPPAAVSSGGPVPDDLLGGPP